MIRSSLASRFRAVYPKSVKAVTNSGHAPRSPPRYFQASLGLIIGAGATTAGFTYYFTTRPKEIHTTMFNGWPCTMRDSTSKSFVTNLKLGPHATGDEVTSADLLLSKEECEKMLKLEEETKSFKLDGIRVKVDVNSVGANRVNEDRWAVDVVDTNAMEEIGLERTDRMDTGFWGHWTGLRTSLFGEGWKGDDEAKEGGLVMFSVFDGHGPGDGWVVSELVRKVLHPCLAWAIASHKHPVAGGLQISDTENLVKRWTGQWYEARDKGSMVKIIKQTTAALDADIIQAPLNHFHSSPSTTSSSMVPLPSVSVFNLAPLLTPGACAATAILDQSSGNLYVANLGDCRVLAGWCDPKTGSWRYEQLSEDQTSENPKEQARTRADHPDEDQDTLILDEGFGSRILGIIQPSRSFGGGHNKRSIKETDKLNQALRTPHYTFPGPKVKPPYVGSEAEVICRPMQRETGEQLRFVVLATDGLWDKLSSAEVASLTACHLDQPKTADIPKADFKMIPTSGGSLDTSIEGLQPRCLSWKLQRDWPGRWVFGRGNAATHLIRNATGRGDEGLRQKMLSMRGPLTRQVRDDTTVIVVSFDRKDNGQERWHKKFP